MSKKKIECKNEIENTDNTVNSRYAKSQCEQIKISEILKFKKNLKKKLNN